MQLNLPFQTKTVDTLLEKWTDEECLFEFTKFFNRVGITTEFVQDSEGVITHEILHMLCGNKLVSSAPQELDWPVQPMPYPELGGEVN